MAGRRIQVGAVVTVTRWVAGAARAQEDAGVASTVAGPAETTSADAGYNDATDLFLAVGWGKEEHARPEPYKLYPAVLPAVGYSPSVGALLGVVGQFGMYLGDPCWR